ncbi:MAG: undecaprenyl-diphosphate phosphatase, partial [Solirubrobacterales bacterium]
VVLSGFYELTKILSGEEAVGVPFINVAVATVVAFVVGYAVIAWFLRYLSNNSFALFVGYRLVLGTGVLILAAAGLIST